MFTPLAVARIMITTAEVRSAERAERVLRDVSEITVSDNTILRLLKDVGGELATRRDLPPSHANCLATTPENIPELAVVECDGGRIRTREMGHGPGVHLPETGWREDKNACFIHATRKTFAEDPQPEPPDCFCDAKHVAKMAETEALSVAAPVTRMADEDDLEPEPTPAVPKEDWRPQRKFRTVLSSLEKPGVFGRQMQREAKRRRFYEAPAQVFLGDGLGWNWSIWKRFFPTFTPVLDFIHVLSYLFIAAKAIHAEASDAWDQYLAWMRGCWRGEVAQVLQELQVWQTRLGEPAKDSGETDPRRILAKTITYLTNNQERMKYPDYRRAGLPVTTAWMESLVKEINLRVKGTEMFWNDPVGAEAILQVRAAALSDDDRLIDHLTTRPGSPFTRRRNPPKSTAKATTQKI
jgi:hypothetical protein